MKLRRDTAANLATFTPAQGECVVDTTNNRLCVGDGSTANGWALAKLTEVTNTAHRTAVADAAYTATTADRIIAYTSITAARAVSLPAASAFPVGTPLWVVDESGAVTGTNYIAINRNGSDTINGASSVALTGPYQAVAIESNGSNGWGIIAGIPNIGASLVGIGTGPDSTNPLSVKAGQALFNAVSTGFTIYVNKASSGANASLLFEDSFASKAQIGLIADDNFHAQVYNGSSWLDALKINNSTGVSSIIAPAQGDNSAAAISSTWFGQNYKGGFVNLFCNPHMDVAQRGSSGSVSAGTTAYTLDRWQISATGAAAAWSQQYNANIAGSALRISAATGLSACTLQQRIESYVAALMATAAKGAQTVTVQFQVYNATGASITPKIAAGYASAQDNFTTVTADLAATNLQTIANGATGLLAYTFTPSSTNFANGYQIQLQFGGALNASSGYVDVTLADIRVTPGVSVGLNSAPPLPELRDVSYEINHCQRYFVQHTSVGNYNYFGSGYFVSSTQMRFGVLFPNQMRVNPTLTTSSNSSFVCAGSPSNFSVLGFPTTSMDAFGGYINITVSGATAGQGSLLADSGTPAYLAFSAEL